MQTSATVEVSARHVPVSARPLSRPWPRAVRSRHMNRKVVAHISAATVAAMAAVAVLVVLTPATAQANPPNIPSASTAMSRLNALTVAAESHGSTYNRDLFPHWITITGSCNTREQVLKRDGSGVAVDSGCYPTSGSWYSPYDGATWTNPSDIDIDHM